MFKGKTKKSKFTYHLTMFLYFSGFIARTNFAFNLTAVKELIEKGFRAITPDEWARCVDHVKSVERTYRANEIAVEEEHETVPVVVDQASTQTAAQIPTPPAKQKACEFVV